MHTALFFDIFLQYLLRQINVGWWLLITIISCLMSTSPLTAQSISRCDQPVFGAVGIAIDQRAATAAEARQFGVDAAAKTAFLKV